MARWVNQYDLVPHITPFLYQLSNDQTRTASAELKTANANQHPPGVETMQLLAAKSTHPVRGLWID